MKMSEDPRLFPDTELNVSVTSEITDTDRLNYLLEFFCVDDIGDKICTPGISINFESLEEKLSFGPCESGECQILCSFGDQLRTVIDKSIFAHKTI